MTDFKENSNGSCPPPKPKRNTTKTLFFVGLFGILVVLFFANLDAILKPVNALNAILTPIYIGLVIAYICNPILRFCEAKIFYKVKRRTANRALSMLLTYAVVLAILAGVIWLIIPNVVESINDIRANAMGYIETLINSINRFISSLPFQLPGGSDNLISFEKLLTYLMEWLGSYGSSLVGNIGDLASGMLTVLKNIIVGIFISIYVLLSKERLNAGCRRVIHALFSEKNEKKLLYYTGQANQKFGGFLVGKIVDSFAVGLTCALLFSIFKIPYPVLIAVIIGVTDFIPFFGPFIGAIPSAVIIFIASPSKALLFVILILVVQQIDGNLLAPLILGDHTGLTSLGVLVAITVMGGLFGFAGLLIGVPLFALLMIILDDFIKLRLKEKGSPTDLNAYYPADAFIKPADEAEGKSGTLTQRFMHWVAAVETEEIDPDMMTKGRKFNIGFRRVCLKIGRFFGRIFSTKQIPEDQRSSYANLVLKRGMATNRSFLRTALLTIFTLGIYPLYLVEIMAESANIAFARDGKRTWGFLPFLILSIVTLGIYPIIWHCQLIRRYERYCETNGQQCRISMKRYLLWTLLGLPILIGPLVAIGYMLAAFTQTCRIFNETHTFPLSREALEAEAAGNITPYTNEAAKKAIKQAKKAGAKASKNNSNS